MKKVLSQISTVWNGQTERGQGGTQHVIKGAISLRDVVVKFSETNALNKVNFICHF